jgi:hypothetical protein
LSIPHLPLSLACPFFICLCICLIHMSSFYFWSPALARKMRKTNMRYYPKYPSGSWHPILAP